MEKIFDPQKIEEKWYQQWEKNHCFSPNDAKEAFSIAIPPPNVTGSLHMGHGFQYTLMDALVRFERMRGKNTLWQVGTDHAGISTQLVVERQLAAKNITRQELGRNEFEKKIWEWKQLAHQTITQQMRRLGISVDWSRERFTLDEKFNHAVLTVFIALYNQGIIYRGTRLVNWDPNFLSAISDLEVNYVEEKGKIWHLRYPLADQSGFLTVATTRPETMLGDTAVAVHPEDQRYKKLIGKQIKLPLTERMIPIIADHYVDKEFGSGCVKITPAHDFNDYTIGLRHKLPMINIFTPDAKMNDHVPEIYRGLDRFKAREVILADLTKLNLIEKVENHTNKIPRSDRGNTIIEPYLTEQWFMNMQDLSKRALAVVSNGDIEFIPENWQKVYFQWLEHIEDWCISRQLWWGHRIPAWYDENRQCYVGLDEADVRKKYKLDPSVSLKQDEDVLDTWFSSALWPFATLGWPEQTAAFKTFYPTNILITGFDIIFFWVARMIMMGLEFTQEIPFQKVLFTGLIRDSEGQKMSKTKGNVLDPLDLIDGIDLDTLLKKRLTGLIQSQMADKIEKQTRKEFPNGIIPHGTDALRFTFISLATPHREIRFDLNRLEASRNFCNKIWNAARYVLMNLQDYKISDAYQPAAVDQWILHQLANLNNLVIKHLEELRFDLVAQDIYDFTWNQFCDWYLEFTKPQLNGGQRNNTQFFLIFVLEKLLAIIHPFMPFITEEIWQALKPYTNPKKQFLMISDFPHPKNYGFIIDEAVVLEINFIKDLITTIRTLRAEINIAPKTEIKVLIQYADQNIQNTIKKHENLIFPLARIEHIQFIDDKSAIPPAATTVIGKLIILLPLAGIIDKNMELQRLTKEITKLKKDEQHSLQKLQNENFVAKAPQELINAEKEIVAKVQEQIKKLEQKYQMIQGL